MPAIKKGPAAATDPNHAEHIEKIHPAICIVKPLSPPLVLLFPGVFWALDRRAAQ